jgi:hypothetical protein
VRLAGQAGARGHCATGHRQKVLIERDRKLEFSAIRWDSYLAMLIF